MKRYDDLSRWFAMNKHYSRHGRDFRRAIARRLE
jgi:hypothetical protein